MRTTRFKAAAVLAVGIVAFVTGCTASPTDNGSESLQAIDVVAQVGGQLEAVGIEVTPGSLDCEGALPAKTGESTSCTFDHEGQPVGLVATVDKVDGTAVAIKIATEARPVVKANLEEAVRLRVEEEMNANLNQAVCAGELGAEKGATTTCTLTGGGQTRKVKVTTTSVDDGLVEFRIDEA